MDTLRACNLSSMLTTSHSPVGCTSNNHAGTSTESHSTTTTKKSGGSSLAPTNLDNDNVNALVRTFGGLSKHEKILFLINIREFTREGTLITHTPVKTENGRGGVLIKTEPEETASSPCASSSSQHILPNSPPPPGTGSRSNTPVATATSSSSSSSAVVTSSSNQSVRLSKTSNWLQKTFIQDSQVALPKEEVYNLYKVEFIRLNEKPISTADFGKLMRQVFPDVKARRLGQRGQSKYCYANIRKRSEIEKPALPTPLPQNELISWAKNKFNIDFSEVTQVVSYLKCENTSGGGSGGSSTRKRRASCGGSLLKQNNRNHATKATRSASVSVLELENKDDPLMILHDNESLEIGSYFENSVTVAAAAAAAAIGAGASSPSSSTNTTSSNWPQLRSLLTTDDSNSNSTFTSFGGNVMIGSGNGMLAGTSTTGVSSLLSSLTSSTTKKKRHSSSVQFEFIKPDMGGSGVCDRSSGSGGSSLLLHRSQSVPVTEMSFLRSTTLDELQATSTSSIFDELTGGVPVVIGGVSVNEPTNNPLFSSASVSGSKTHPVSSTSSGCSSNSSVMFESIGEIGATGSGTTTSTGSVIGVDVIGGVADVVVGGSGVGVSGLGGVGTSSLLLSNGGVSSHVGSDVFFDSVFDLMMSDCQN